MCLWCDMVKDYLEKTKQRFLEERVNLVKQEKMLNNHIKENIKFIQLLEETNDSNYESFTPRDVNPYNRNRIHELEEEQKTIMEQLNDVQSALSELDCKIGEIESVIKVAKENAVSESDINRLALLETQEKERQRIARNLHDSTIQNLTSLLHKSELCSKLIEVDPIRCRLELLSLNKVLHDIIEDTRHMIYNLHPMSFDDIGFEVTIEHYLDELKNHSNIRFIYKTEGNPYRLASVVSLTLLRIIQEACNNSIKYANPSTVNITLTYQKDALQLTIIDDGEGFDLNTLPEKSREDHSGFGLSMMRERVYLLSGTLDIKSEIGKGCVILINIPIKEDV